MKTRINKILTKQLCLEIVQLTLELQDELCNADIENNKDIVIDTCIKKILESKKEPNKRPYKILKAYLLHTYLVQMYGEDSLVMNVLHRRIESGVEELFKKPKEPNESGA